MRIRTRLTALVLVAALAALPGAAHARQKKYFKAKIGSITLHAIKRGIQGVVIIGGGGFTLNAPGRKGFTAQLLALVCESPGGITVGATYSCGGAFGQSNPRRPTQPKGWSSNDQVQVTVTAYSGTYLAGTLSGTLENPGDQNPNDGPAAISGKFGSPMIQQ